MQTIGKTAAGRVPTSGAQITEIVDSEYLGEYRLKLKFSDGREQDVDFEPFLTGSRHPAIRRYLDTQAFQSYTLRHGNIDWNDYDLVFPVADLYRGEI